MRLLSIFVALAFMVSVVALSQAEEKKSVEKTLSGTITCAKCDLKLASKCATVIKVKDGEKDVIYYFAPDSDKKYHKQICTEAKEGTVTGTVSKEGTKNIISVTKLDYK